MQKAALGNVPDIHLENCAEKVLSVQTVRTSISVLYSSISVPTENPSQLVSWKSCPLSFLSSLFFLLLKMKKVKSFSSLNPFCLNPK